MGGGFLLSYARARACRIFVPDIYLETQNSIMRKLLTIAALFAALCASAQTLTITAGSAEVSGSAKNQLYPLRSLFFNYNTETDKFEAFQTETRDKVYEANISTVTISGQSTAANKIAWLENTHLKCNNGVYNILVPKDGIAVRYRSSNKYTELFPAISEGKKALFSGPLDSIKTASTDSTSALRLTALRKIIRGATPQLVGNNDKAATIAAGAAAGSSPTISVTGNGLSGEITLTTGTTATTTGVLCTLTLPAAFPNGARVIITASNTNAAVHIARVFATTTSGTVVLNASGTALSDATAYKWFYTVTGY